MQKREKTASILIWTIFLSVFIGVFFISISTQIKKNLENFSYVDSQRENGSIVLEKIKNLDFSNQNLSNAQKLEFDSLFSYSGTLKNTEKKEFRFFSGSTINITLGSENNAPLEYKFLSFSGATGDGSITASGVVSSSLSFSGILDTDNDSGILMLKNLGGYNQIFVTSNNAFQRELLGYKIMQTIGGKQFKKYSGEIEQFKQGDFSGLDYLKYDLY